MIYFLLWFGIFLLLALWSLAAWALHAVGVWAVINAGALGKPVAGLEFLGLPPWLAAWLPAEATRGLNALMSAFGPWVETLLAQAPSWSGGLSLAVWVLWALGAGLLVLLGLGGSAAVTLWRRRVGRARAARVTPSPSTAR